MLLIRPEQLAAFEQAATAAYARDLAAYLRRAAPDSLRELDDTAARERVLRAVEEARQWNVRSALATAAFVQLTLLSPGFTTDPVAQQELREDPHAAPPRLLARLRAR